MSNNIFGRSNAGRERGSSSSSRKRQKNYSSEKPNKQPKRGLGVAQLERIRLHGEMAMGYHPSLDIPHCPHNCTNEEGFSFRVPTAGYSSTATSSPFAHSTPPFAESNPSITTGFAEYERANRFSYLHESAHHARWGAGVTNLKEQPFTPQTTTNIQFLNLQEKDSQQKKRHRSDSIGSSNQHSRSSDSEEIDLELRL